jgi:nicotinate-nucleotide adenylyltransferase
VTAARVAVYGGSFDPPHLGHVLSVAWALSTGDVDEVWIIPTWEHVFEKSHQASYEHRTKLCEAAFAPFRDVRLLDIERQLGGTSRTLRTLEALQEAHPHTSFRLLIGADVLPTTDRWHRWDEVARLAPPLIVGREGYPQPAGCPITIPNVSSTDVRAALGSDRNIQGFVPGAVADYIRQHGLYSSDP